MIDPVYSVYVHVIPASARVVILFDPNIEVVERELIKQKIGSIGERSTKGDERETVTKTYFGVSLWTSFEVKQRVSLHELSTIQMRSHTIRSC